jgi:hypothetical protein
MPLRIQTTEKLDLKDLISAFSGMLLGSIEWQKSIGRPSDPRPEKAFRIKVMRYEKVPVPHGEDKELPIPVDLLHMTSSESDTRIKVSFSILNFHKVEMDLSVAFSDEMRWVYPNEVVKTAGGHPEFKESHRRVTADELSGGGPWVMDPFIIELRPIGRGG